MSLSENTYSSTPSFSKALLLETNRQLALENAELRLCRGSQENEIRELKAEILELKRKASIFSECDKQLRRNFESFVKSTVNYSTEVSKIFSTLDQNEVEEQLETIIDNNTINNKLKHSNSSLTASMSLRAGLNGISTINSSGNKTGSIARNLSVINEGESVNEKTLSLDSTEREKYSAYIPELKEGSKQLEDDRNSHEDIITPSVEILQDCSNSKCPVENDPELDMNTSSIIVEIGNESYLDSPRNVQIPNEVDVAVKKTIVERKSIGSPIPRNSVTPRLSLERKDQQVQLSLLNENTPNLSNFFKNSRAQSTPNTQGPSPSSRRALFEKGVTTRRKKSRQIVMTTPIVNLERLSDEKINEIRKSIGEKNPLGELQNVDVEHNKKPRKRSKKLESLSIKTENISENESGIENHRPRRKTRPVCLKETNNRKKLRRD